MLRNRFLEKIGSAKSIVLLSSAFTLTCYSNHALAQSNTTQERCYQQCYETIGKPRWYPGPPRYRKKTGRAKMTSCIETCISAGQPGVPAPTTPTGAPGPTDNPACKRYPNLC